MALIKPIEYDAQGRIAVPHQSAVLSTLLEPDMEAGPRRREKTLTSTPGYTHVEWIEASALDAETALSSAKHQLGKVLSQLEFVRGYRKLDVGVRKEHLRGRYFVTYSVVYAVEGATPPDAGQTGTIAALEAFNALFSSFKR